ncbi:MAG: hypothetical protein HDQ87_07880 [Clostridia bacterium]|nr:hypothetical protein [Clostridia bacterium]
MAQHGNRSERHEAEIRKNVDRGHLEYELEQAKQREATEKFNEKNRNEHHAAEKYNHE